MNTRARRILVVLLAVAGASILWLQTREPRVDENSVRLEAMETLLRVSTHQERHYLQNGFFSEDLIPLGFPSEAFVTRSGSWKLSIDPGADENDFTARVIYVGNDDAHFRRNCKWMTITARGQRASGPDPSCWPR